MPAFEANILDANPDGNAMLTMVLHATPQARSAAIKRGEARLIAGSMLEAMTLDPRARNKARRVAAFG